MYPGPVFIRHGFPPPLDVDRQAVGLVDTLDQPGGGDPKLVADDTDFVLAELGRFEEPPQHERLHLPIPFFVDPPPRSQRPAGEIGGSCVSMSDMVARLYIHFRATAVGVEILEQVPPLVDILVTVVFRGVGDDRRVVRNVRIG